MVFYTIINFDKPFDYVFIFKMNVACLPLILETNPALMELVDAQYIRQRFNQQKTHYRQLQEPLLVRLSDEYSAKFSASCL